MTRTVQRQRATTAPRAIPSHFIMSPIPPLAGPCGSALFEDDVLGAVPEHPLAQGRQLLAAHGDGQEVVAGELADLAGEADAAVAEQDFALAQAAGIEDELA